MKLSNQTLGSLGPDIIVPGYDRSCIQTGIIHIGPSHFARGHIFRYVDSILETDPRWGVVAISLKSSRARDVLREQDNLYTVIEQAGDHDRKRVIGALKEVIVASEEPRRALMALIDPSVKLVTMTVTQKGYYHDPLTGALDFKSPDIVRCLSSMDEPGTTVGYLVAAIDQRRRWRLPPLTIMSCDNIPGNGDILRNVVLAYAGEKSEGLRRYIEDHIAFPSTMVDRIVPTTTLEQVAGFADREGFVDAWPIFTERFRQWAIQDNFAGDVPDFASAKAMVAPDVSPLELMKIRMLNGAHMALGCVAGLAGHRLVDRAMQDPDMAAFVKGFMDEAAGTLQRQEEVDYDIYRNYLMMRLENPKMGDQLTRLARNGTQKLGSRFLEPAKDAIAAGGEYQHIAFAVAAWIRYLQGTTLAGGTLDISDDAAVKSGLQELARQAGGDPRSVIAESGLFDNSLLAHKGFMDSVRRHLGSIRSMGMSMAIRQLQGEEPTNQGLAQGAQLHYGAPACI